MDCCNYMQYRHPYYAAPFYENGLYARDFYGHPYQSYYPSPPYYSSQQSTCPSFSDYVYNPKEARIRKAMREASRERITGGAAPMSSPRGSRRSQTWGGNPEEQLMMAPSPELGSSLCIFPGPSSSQFLQPNYTKLVHVLPSNNWLQDAPTYIQHNPMAELQQHQNNMWQQYQEPTRFCSGPTYMMDAPMPLYQEMNGGSEVLPHKKCKSEIETVYQPNENDIVDQVAAPQLPTPSKLEEEKDVKNEKNEEKKEAEAVVEGQRTLSDSAGGESRTEPFLPVFPETVVVQNPFDKDDDVKLKKPQIPSLKRTGSKHSTKALPDFNEAFGSTERGRFQSPPDPRLAPNKGYLDFFLHDPIKFDNYQI